MFNLSENVIAFSPDTLAGMWLRPASRMLPMTTAAYTKDPFLGYCTLKSGVCKKHFRKRTLWQVSSDVNVTNPESLTCNEICQ